MGAISEMHRIALNSNRKDTPNQNKEGSLELLIRNSYPESNVTSYLTDKRHQRQRLFLKSFDTYSTYGKYVRTVGTYVVF